MSGEVLFKAAYPFQADVERLPVQDIDEAAKWYCNTFGMEEIERRSEPRPAVVLARDGVKIGFEVNGGDASQDGAAVLVADIHRARDELTAKGVSIGNWRIDERDGSKFQVFFVIAPDGLCYYFHQPLND
ncbi:MAG: VOC family protein [Alphaproteobacteria bacterium]|nr:VOC family protein [Alphaproteobacteria bacterium]